MGSSCRRDWLATRYTDGLIEARNRARKDFSAERPCLFAASAGHLRPRTMVEACMHDLREFSAAPGMTDDLTLMALRRV